MQELVTRIAQPEEFAQPDPSRFIKQACSFESGGLLRSLLLGVMGQGDGTIGGVPAIVLIGVVVLLLSISVVIPGQYCIPPWANSLLMVSGSKHSAAAKLN